MKSIKSKSVECCTVKTCERQTCQSFSKRLTSKCPWGTVVQAIEFGKQGISVLDVSLISNSLSFLIMQQWATYHISPDYLKTVFFV